MSNNLKYKIPDKYVFPLHHVRPRFKNDVEEVLLYVANSISQLEILPLKEFNDTLNEILKNFRDNRTKEKKTLDNWRTEISALFAFIQREGNSYKSSLMAQRLSNNQYLDELFNYFLFSFQYPGGHIKNYRVIEQIKKNIKFKPCKFILQLLKEGEKLSSKNFYITAE